MIGLTLLTIGYILGVCMSALTSAQWAVGIVGLVLFVLLLVGIWRARRTERRYGR